MAKITIDNQEVEFTEGVNVLQAALDAGLDVPHYCYHPGLSISASCRICLMEMMAPDPKTKEMVWMPKLMPSCQTPARDGMVVRFQSDTVQKARENVMEFLLLDHPLDCPVCDQAGECLLQDYSYRFGKAQSRMVDQKDKDPKRDIGPKTLLYGDRCIDCTRCVRFTHEISGTKELCETHRGSKVEIDVFPGYPLDNPLSGNVVDVCPVGSMLDKDFLFAQRVWMLDATKSVCPGCARGCSIRIDHNRGKVYRLKPRYNPEVNNWWICDAGRYGYKHIHDERRLTTPMMRGRGEVAGPTTWEKVIAEIRARFAPVGDAGVAAVLSPFMACEEAWLLAKFVRDISPEATLVLGPVPQEGEDMVFPPGATGDDVKFTILAEKCPNRRGIEMVIEAAGGKSVAFDAFVKQAKGGAYASAWVAGGYPEPWLPGGAEQLADGVPFLVVGDLYPSVLSEAAAVVLPSCSFAERDGCYVSAAGLVQVFDRAIAPVGGVRRDGQLLYEMAGLTGLFSAKRVRELMAETMPAFADPYVPPEPPAHAH